MKKLEYRLEQKIENERGLKKFELLTLLSAHNISKDKIKKTIKDAVVNDLVGMKNAIIIKLEDRVLTLKKKNNFSERNNLKYENSKRS